MATEFLSGVKAGDYIKIAYSSNKPLVSKVFKVTKTQIIISECGWGNEPQVDRFRISNGCRIGDSRYHMTRIIEAPVSPEEIAIYESNRVESERIRTERKRLNELEIWAKDKLSALFREHIPADNIKVQYSSNDGMKTVFFEIKCEKVSENSLIQALTPEPAAGKQ